MADDKKYKTRSGKDRRKLDKIGAAAVSEGLKELHMDKRYLQRDRRKEYHDESFHEKLKRMPQVPYNSDKPPAEATIEMRKAERRQQRTKNPEANRRYGIRRWADAQGPPVDLEEERHYLEDMKRSKSKSSGGLHPETEKAVQAFIKKYKDKSLRGKITQVKRLRGQMVPAQAGTTGRIASKLLKGGGWLGLGAALGAATKVGIEAYKKDKKKKK